MSKEVTTVASLQSKVKDHIRDKFADLIPDEVWEDLVEKTVDDFMEKKLKAIIVEELETICKEKLKEALPRKFQAKYANGQELAGEELEKIIIERAPELFSSLIGGAMQRIINEASYRI